MKLETRIKLEHQIVRRIVRDLLAAGYELTVNNGGEENEIPWSRNFSEIASALFATDDEHILTRKIGEQTQTGSSFVYLVYGNDAWEVVNDYGMSLEHVMGGINKYCERLEELYV